MQATMTAGPDRSATGPRTLRTGSVDAVLAESSALSLCLAAEVVVDDLLRVLRPGGRLLLVVESLLLGLARLADQGRWAELADVPSADVVLVPTDTGGITRCFWPEELTELLGAAGFTVDWVRPRSVLSPSTVERALDMGGDEPAGTLTVPTSDLGGNSAELAVGDQKERDQRSGHTRHQHPHRPLV